MRQAQPPMPDGKPENLSTQTRSDYCFDGWYGALTGGDKITEETMFTNDAEIYARWTKIATNGGSLSTSRSSDDSSVSSLRTVNEPNLGTVRVTLAAVGGSKVVITAGPDLGYAVDTVTVTDTKVQRDSLTKVNDTIYTFSQFESKVDIDVIYRQKEYIFVFSPFQLSAVVDFTSVHHSRFMLS